MLKLLVFDLDGTLADTRMDLARSVNHALGSMGHSLLPLETVIGFVGDGARNLLLRSLAASGTSGEAHSGDVDIDLAVTAFMDHYLRHCLGETAAYPGVAASLETLSGYRKAVLTNKPEAPARNILKGLGLASHFIRIFGGDNPFGQKPDPTALREIMRLESALPEETLLIGDGIQDLQAARRAGCRFLAFLGGMGSVSAMLAGNPEATFTDMRNLPEAVAAIAASEPAIEGHT